MYIDIYCEFRMQIEKSSNFLCPYFWQRKTEHLILGKEAWEWCYTIIVIFLWKDGLINAISSNKSIEI